MPMLSVSNLQVVYGGVVSGLRGVSLEVQEGDVVTLLGANGAGKTTCLRAITGLLRFHGGEIRGGVITLDGERIDGLDAPQVVRRGIAQVLEGRRIFPELTVDENLRSGALLRRDGAAVRRSYARAVELFPVLGERRGDVAGYLSSGEQQMLAIGRALMAAPRLLLLDEPSLGLAPMVVQQIGDIILEINRTGTSVVLVEQNAGMALAVASHGYLLENGRIVMDDRADVLARDHDIRQFYLGLAEGRRSHREDRQDQRPAGWLDDGDEG